jgi:hypothetical protein
MTIVKFRNPEIEKKEAGGGAVEPLRLAVTRRALQRRSW